MKKVLLVLISVLLVLSFIGCSEEDEASYTLSYDKNGLDYCDPSMIVEEYTVGDTVTVLDGAIGDKLSASTYYHHWTMAADGSGDQYTAGETFEMPANNVILYAQEASVDK